MVKEIRLLVFAALAWVAFTLTAAAQAEETSTTRNPLHVACGCGCRCENVSRALRALSRREW